MMYSAYKLKNRVTIYSLDILLFLLDISLLFHVQFYLLLLDLYIDFSGGRSGGLVFPSLDEFSIVCCDPYSKGFCIVNEMDVFLEILCFLHDPVNIDNLISVSSASLKPSWYMWKFLVDTMLKPSLKDFKHNLVFM